MSAASDAFEEAIGAASAREASGALRTARELLAAWAAVRSVQ